MCRTKVLRLMKLRDKRQEQSMIKVLKSHLLEKYRQCRASITAGYQETSITHLIIVLWRLSALCFGCARARPLEAEGGIQSENIITDIPVPY
ncbi:unnamed protein product [Danaus chrysippus]|uniref:(African queen) hypothetical protein n=1 Tax=Danaus chrysippus TaxID=151541 RepID=A0A8J2R462_9NEOP|nr:unnamed protein product [Danaus chrysippus]